MEYNGGWNPELQRYLKEFQDEIQSLTNQNSLLEERLELSEPISKATKLTLDELNSLHVLIVQQMSMIKDQQDCGTISNVTVATQTLSVLVALLPSSNH